MPKKPSQSEIAEKFGVNQATISRLKRNGVDIYNDDAVEHALRSVRAPAPAIKQLQEEKPMPSVDSSNGSYAEIKTKEQAEIEEKKRNIQLKDIKIAVEEKKYISRGEGEESAQAIGAIFRASILRLESDLPQQLEGKSAKEIQKILHSKLYDALQDASEKLEMMGRGESEAL